ncbi:RyR domain-containing protein [Gilvimarinus sp. DA14]|uniref:RyR domain-containing protein n=1 Tax=Gilvimarinus sp. DA14 TaxID=2956798 RepID=UPI0020B6FA8A|nr:RyR domain-containing protein [Gilvimarinus sp. DA14]UTF59003.1 hypothetical protein NHM04_10995 [Gilvimarinus sp. DA14]
MNASSSPLIRAYLPFTVLLIFNVYAIATTSYSTGNIANDVYRALGLFAFEGDWTMQESKSFFESIIINISRFGSAVFTVGFILAVLLSGFRAWLIKIFRPRRGHVVIFGSGPVSQTILESAIAKGKRCIFFEICGAGINQSSPNIRSDCAHYKYETLDCNLLGGIGLSHSDSIFVCATDDSQSVYLAKSLIKHIDSRCDSIEKIKIFLHLSDAKIREGYIDLSELTGDSAIDVRLWSAQQIAVESLFRNFPPLRYTKIKGKPSPNLVIISDGDCIESVVNRFIDLCMLTEGELPTITIYAGPHAETSSLDKSSLSIISNITIRTFSSIYDESFESDVVDSMSECTQVVIFGMPELNQVRLSASLYKSQLSNALFSAPIIRARLDYDYYSDPVKSIFSLGPNNIHDFYAEKHLVSYASILSRDMNNMAKEIHLKIKESESQRGGWQPWSRLSNELRESNRKSSISWEDKLSALKIETVDSVSEIELTAPEKEHLVALEHSRWYAERIRSGWRYGKKKSTILKKNPLLQQWANLPKTSRDDNIKWVSESFNIFQKALEHPILPGGTPKGLARVRTICVVGHRWLHIQDKAYEARLIEKIDSRLKDLKRTHENSTFHVVSALAEGADRLVAERCIEVLGAKLIVILPMPYSYYRQDFSGKDSIVDERSELEFLKIFKKASWHCELPPVYHDPMDLETPDSKGRLSQYSALGEFLCQAGDDLIALWDGKEAKGQGGTSEVVDKWINHKPPPTIESSSCQNIDSDPGFFHIEIDRNKVK